jgi:hypothetical protein
MTTFKYTVNGGLVCSTCQSNDKVHYNLVAFPRNGRVLIDPDTQSWCARCEAEANMVIPNKDFPYDEIRRDDGNYFDSWKEVKAAGYAKTQTWCITTGDSEHGTWFCYDSSPHFVNVMGYVATKEHAKPGECYEELLLNEEPF